MAASTWTANPYIFSMTVTHGGVSTNYLQNIGQFSLQWQRPLRFVKDISVGAPSATYGASQGQFTLQGVATTSLTTAVATSRMIWTGGNPNPTAVSVLTLAFRENKDGTPVSSTYSGFLVGKGFTHRQVAERYWVLDGVATFRFID
jgi:hypothetical protein